MEKKKFDEKKYKLEYNAKNYIRVPLDLNVKNDADIIEYLEKLENRTGKIKELIRVEIEEEKNMRKLKIINENETQNIENDWYIFNISNNEWFGYNLNDYVILTNAEGKYILAKKYDNCISIGSGSITEFETFEELKRIILENSEELENIINKAKI